MSTVLQRAMRVNVPHILPNDLLPKMTLLRELVLDLVSVAVLVIYSVFGGYIFYLAEYENDLNAKLEQSARINATISSASKDFYQFCILELPSYPGAKLKIDSTKSALSWFAKKLNVTPFNVDPSWDLWSSTFFATTLYTTVGYGNIAPVSSSGRVFTIVYSIIGIPIMLTILNQWGKQMFYVMKAAWKLFTKMCRYCPCSRCCYRRPSGLPFITQKMGGNHRLSQIHDEEVRVPTLVALFILFAWICLFAAIYYAVHRDWTYPEAVYFFFISLTTIGLGDFVPDTPERYVIGYILVVLGMSVISLCINVIQSNIEGQFHRMLHNVDTDYRNRLAAGETQPQPQEVLPAKGTSFREKLLYSMMDKTKKDMLQERIESRCKMKNAFTQTQQNKVEMCIQVGDEPVSRNPHGLTREDISYTDLGNDLRSFRRASSSYPGRMGKRSYIYSVTD